MHKAPTPSLWLPVTFFFCASFLPPMLFFSLLTSSASPSSRYRGHVFGSWILLSSCVTTHISSCPNRWGPTRVTQKKRVSQRLLVWPPHLWFMRLRRKTRRKERLKWEGEELSEGSPELRPLEEGWGGYGWDRMGRTKTGTELKWLGCYLMSQTTIFQQQSLSTPLWWGKIMQMEAPLQLQYSRKSK